MASFLYLLGCATLAALAVLELKTQNRTHRVQVYLVLLCATVFCGIFALLVSAAQASGGQFSTVAELGILPLTGGLLLALTRTNRRLQRLPAAPRRRRHQQ